MSISTTYVSSTEVPRQPLVASLAALCEHLCDWPSQTVAQALDVLGIDPAGIPGDLFDLPGACACEAIEAELIIQRAGWLTAEAA